MWVMLSDAFFSIVKKDCARDELLVRARRHGDIEKVFPGARVIKVEHADYLYRAPVKIKEVVAAMTGELHRISYDNFKNSVDDKPLHDAYLRVWSAMTSVQETPPYGADWHNWRNGSIQSDEIPVFPKDRLRRQNRKRAARGERKRQ